MDLVDHLVVFILFLLDGVFLELVNLAFNFIQLILEGFSLQVKALLNIVTLLLEVGFLLLDVCLNLIGHLVGQNNVLNVFIGNLDVRLFLEHHEPCD